MIMPINTSLKINHFKNLGCEKQEELPANRDTTNVL